MVGKSVLLGLILNMAACLPGSARCLLELEFGNESAALSGPSQAILNRIIEIYPQSAIGITGHADLAANAAGNRTLAAARAQAVRNYVVQAGVSPQDVAVQSGAAQPGASRQPGPVASGRVVRLEVTPCDPAFLTEASAASGSAPSGAIGALGGAGAAGGALFLTLLALSLAGSETSSSTTSTSP